jgi:hypothetical protein
MSDARRRGTRNAVDPESFSFDALGVLRAQAVRAEGVRGVRSANSTRGDMHMIMQTTKSQRRRAGRQARQRIKQVTTQVQLQPTELPGGPDRAQRKARSKSRNRRDEASYGGLFKRGQLPTRKDHANFGGLFKRGQVPTRRDNASFGGLFKRGQVPTRRDQTDVTKSVSKRELQQTSNHAHTFSRAKPVSTKSA